MTRTHAEHAALLAPYRDPDTDLIDTRAFAADYNINCIAAMYGPDNGDPNNATYRVARDHNAEVRAEGAEDAPKPASAGGSWLRGIVSMVIALAAGLLAR